MRDLHKIVDRLSYDQREGVLAFLRDTLPLDQLEDLVEDPEPEFELITSAEFADGDYSREWLIDDVLTRGQPAILGGPKKALKTGVSVDLALSLGSASSFLGRFRVPKAVRVAIVSGESGDATLQETAIRIAKSRKLDLRESSVFWGFKLPKLGDDRDLAGLRRAIERHKIEVLILDPTYLCLLAGGSAVDASNMLQMGPALQRVTEVGCTPIMVHHSKKLDKRFVHNPLDLDDLAYSGFAEFARQWLLINRRSPFQEGSGRHELWLKIGGSFGHSSLWGVDVEEGQLSTRFAGRTWDVTVRPADAVREAATTQARDEKDGDAIKSVLTALESGPQTQTKLRGALGWRTDRLKRVLDLGVTRNIIEYDGKKYARTETLAA